MKYILFRSVLFNFDVTTYLFSKKLDIIHHYCMLQLLWSVNYSFIFNF